MDLRETLMRMRGNVLVDPMDMLNLLDLMYEIKTPAAGRNDTETFVRSHRAIEIIQSAVRTSKGESK